MQYVGEKCFCWNGYGAKDMPPRLASALYAPADFLVALSPSF